MPVIAAFIDHAHLPDRDDPAAMARLVAEIRALGEVRVLRAYADWTTGPHAAVMAALGVECKHGVDPPDRRNRGTYLMEDAGPVIYGDYGIDTLVVASGVFEAIGLLRWLRLSGRAVRVVPDRGNPEVGPAAEAAVMHHRALAFEALRQVVQAAPPRGFVAPRVLAELWGVLPHFNYELLGYRRFKAFLEAAETAGFCRLHTFKGTRLGVRPPL